MKLLNTHCTSHTGYYLYLFMQTQFKLGIYACTNETHSTANIYFGSNNYRQHKLAKVGIKSSRLSIEYVSFVHA